VNFALRVTALVQFSLRRHPSEAVIQPVPVSRLARRPARGHLPSDALCPIFLLLRGIQTSFFFFFIYFFFIWNVTVYSASFQAVDQNTYQL
jgi:hypothetical protein